MAGWLLRLLFSSSFGRFFAVSRRSGVLLLLLPEGGMSNNPARPGAYPLDGEGKTDAPYPEGPLGEERLAVSSGMGGGWTVVVGSGLCCRQETACRGVTSIGRQAAELPLCMAPAVCACPNRSEQTPDAQRCGM